MSCDREAQVHAYHDRQLGPAAREAFEAHLASCPDCAGLLAELRAVSRLILAAPMPATDDLAAQRYYAAWDVSRQQRGLLRISSWLTGAAAAVLIGSLLLWPQDAGTTDLVAHPPALQQAGAWEPVALMPPGDRGDRPNELIELAQWTADDLSSDGGVR
jgi:anti-sigma factor RsiW